MSDNNIVIYENVEQGCSIQQEKEYESFWSENETFALLSCYENHIDDFRHAKKRKAVWKIISEELSGVGIMRSPEKCERKWLNLIRIYRGKKDGQIKSGRSTSVAYKYYDRMEEILGGRPSYNNSMVIDIGISRETLGRAEEIPEEEVETVIKKSPDTEREERGSSKKIKLAESSPSNKLEYLKMKLKAKQKENERRDERHRELVALEKERLAIELRKIKALEKYLKSKENN